MVIENMMYFALGLLAAGLVALIILPAVWKRAVRLTKRRIEAATPITMAEFRADKDQLRAEFALTTRKLEMTVDSMRQRLAEQLGENNQKRSELAVLQAERDQHQSIVAELEARQTELRARVTELERETTDLAHRLRLRDREAELRNSELATLRDTLHGTAPATVADSDQDFAGDNRLSAEARIASAESQLVALLAASESEDGLSAASDQLLADRLSAEDEEKHLRKAVEEVQAAILAGAKGDTLDLAALRHTLNDIAGNVSRLVYATEAETPSASTAGESLFDRVQRFADEEPEPVPLPPAAVSRTARNGTLAERMANLRVFQGR